jgi:hypothetical protein
MGPIRRSELPWQQAYADWLARLGQSGRLSVTRPGIGLRHEAAAVANRLDGALGGPGLTLAPGQRRRTGLLDMRDEAVLRRPERFGQGRAGASA